MNSFLQQIYSESKLALQRTDGDIYCCIIEMMKSTCNNISISISFDRMMSQLKNVIYFEEDRTPESLSMKYFGFNIFVFDPFDYYLMVDTLMRDKLNEIFSEIVTNTIISDIGQYSIHKSNILSIFEPQEKYVRHTGKNYPYKTILFQDYLDERKDWLIVLEKEINILDSLL